MALLLVLVLLAIPVVELYVTVQVASVIGAGPTVLLLVGFTVAGCWVVKRAGIGVWRRFQAQLQTGETPAAELIDGVLVLLAGVLLVFPGFLTDAVGAVLLLPPTRALARAALRGRVERRLGGDLAFVSATATSAAGTARRRVYVGEAVIVSGRENADRAADRVIDVPSSERET